MTSTPPSPRHRREVNLAARAGRWSARHRRKAILGWLAFVIAAIAIGGAIGTNTLKPHELGTGESGRADRVLHDAGLTDAVSESVLVTAPAGETVESPQVRAAINDVTARADRLEEVSEVRDPVISKDNRSALIALQLAADYEDAADAVGPVSRAVDAAAAEHASVRVEQTGDGSIAKAFDETLEEDFKKAEMYSIPITFAVLFFAFGALVAAGIPLLLGLSAVAAALGLVAIPSQAVAIEEGSASVILLIGLAVGVDYALFYLRREREERAAGRGAEAALQAAAATSGRAVLVSGFTVMASVAGLFVAGSKWYTSYAIGIILVVAIAMVGSVTVLPALLSKLGDRVERGRIPFRRRRDSGGDSRVWNAILGRVLRRPLAAVVVAASLLLALAFPVLDLKLSEAGMGSLPQDLPAVTAFEHAQEQFPGGSRPAVVALQADDVASTEVQRAIEELRWATGGKNGIGAPLGVDVSDDATTARIALPLAGSGVDERSEEALAVLRDDVLPRTLGAVDGATVSVTGPTAIDVDLRDQTESRGPLVFALVLGMGFLVLMATFRSIVVPLKAIVLNLLSVAAGFGFMVLVFQEGWFSGLLDFEPTGTIAAWLPVMMFVILFGLSMDYHVFVLSRVREAYDRGLPMDRAVAEGIRSTAGTVTSAATVMVAVFAVFATLGVLEMKQLGVGLAVAILIDATIVRAVLLPATMKLLGPWNWYLPRSLRWLPRLGDHHGGGAPEPAPARA